MIDKKYEFTVKIYLNVENYKLELSKLYRTNIGLDITRCCMNEYMIDDIDIPDEIETSVHMKLKPIKVIADNEYELERKIDEYIRDYFPDYFKQTHEYDILDKAIVIN